MEMPDVLSAHILEFVREQLRRNWPLVLAFEIRTGRRELQRGEFVAIMPYIGDSRCGSARGVILFAWAVAAASHIAFSGCSTPPSRDPRAGWKARTMGLFPRLPLLLQDSYSIQSIFPIGGLALASSVQHAALHLPHSQCHPPFCTCLHPLVRVLAVDTVQS